jgi:hypothetical protein
MITSLLVQQRAIETNPTSMAINSSFLSCYVVLPEQGTRTTSLLTDRLNFYVLDGR